MGLYIGIRVDGNLIAMAGERMHPGRFCEISAVCTDPAFEKRGYATQLVTDLIARMLERGDTPFLHVVSQNEQAIRVYERIGFVWRATFQLQIVQYIGFDN
jgi:predicted GNAT family acetyltransferase